MQNEGERIELITKDYATLIQSSCSLNTPYMKLSQIFLKEYIRQFPTLSFRKEIIVVTCEVLHQLYKKSQLQYESVSSVIQVSSLCQHYISIPTNKVHSSLQSLLTVTTIERDS